MFKGNARRRVQFQIRLVGLTKQGARFERSDAIVRLQTAVRAAQQAVHDIQAGELRRLKIELGIPKEKAGLARRLTAMSEHVPRIVAQHVAAIQLADSIVAQARPLTNCERSGFVANQPQRQIQTLPVSRITVVRHSHGLPLCDLRGFGIKKNLTEINHKVSVIAKWFRRAIAAVFAVKCVGALEIPT
jgi:hypothetical protein